MNRKDVFDAWAPPGSRWTPWVKPVLFAHVDEAQGVVPLTRPKWARAEVFVGAPADPRYRSSARGRRAAVVVDLPSVEGVAAGLALHDLGFHPIPLYSSLPGPGPGAVVPMERVLAGLLAGAFELQRRPVAVDAPPAFLLDARRAAQEVSPRPGQFDNRSVSFPTDFPSAERLKD